MCVQRVSGVESVGPDGPSQLSTCTRAPRHVLKNWVQQINFYRIYILPKLGPTPMGMTRRGAQLHNARASTSGAASCMAGPSAKPWIRPRTRTRTEKGGHYGVAEPVCDLKAKVITLPATSPRALQEAAHNADSRATAAVPTHKKRR